MSSTVMERLALIPNRLIFDNPVLIKELRSGLRERRLFFVLMAFTIVLLGAALLSLPAMISNAEPEQLPEMGKAFFEVMYWVQLIVLALIIPSLTCGSVSGEKERHSLDMVLASRLSSAEIVAGKLGYALYYITLLLFASLPVASTSFFMGGVSWQHAISSYLQLGLFGTVWALMGLFFSSRETRTNYATSQTYGSVFVSMFFVSWTYAMGRFDLSSLSSWPLGPFTPARVAEAYILYFGCFLYLKSMQRLKPRASTIKAMCWLFLLAFGLLWTLVAYFCNWGLLSGGGDLYFFCIVFWLWHLTWVGMFCNQFDLSSEAEEQNYRKSWFSKPVFWQICLCLGLMVPQWSTLGITGSGEMLSNFVTGCQLCCVYIWALPTAMRALCRLFPSWNFSPGYFFILVLACCVPCLGLFNDSPGLFSGIYLSPLLAFISVTDQNFTTIAALGSRYTLADLSMVSYLVLLVLSLLILVVVPVRKKS